MADNGPHGSFAADTDACAGCHSVHRAQYGSNALLLHDPEALCLSCHDGTKAGTNVEDGVYSQAGSNAYTGTPNQAVEGTDGASLFGGGFVNALMATKWSGQTSANTAFNAVSAPVTSHHDLGASGTVWGSGANNSTPGTYTMECTSCHDPHGNSGYANPSASVPVPSPLPPMPNPVPRTATYRLLRWQPQGSAGFSAPTTSVNWSGGVFPSATGIITPTNTGWRVPDNFAANGTEWYTLGTTNAFAVGDYNAGNSNDAYNPPGHNYRPAAINTAFFCAQCHDRYFNNSRLRNNTDVSAYCNGGNPATVLAPTGPTDISTIDPVYCVPAPSGSAWVWGDNRPSGDDDYMYRHASGDVRISMDGMTAAGAATSVSRSCMACHVAHGTSAASTALASGATLSGDSALLRMDNRSICLRCHAGDVNFTVTP
jgi:predicted CXXCH cytochrome family protein